MSNTITREQFEELCVSKSWEDYDDFHNMLKQITGITAKQYVGYSYYDEAGNYIGDSNDSTVRDLLDNAYIKVVGKGGAE